MWKAGGIVALVTLVLAVGASAGVSPLCGLLCLAPLAGLAAGYLGGLFDKPVTGESSAKVGAAAGAIAGVGGFLGQLIAGGINAMFAEQTAQALRQMAGAAGDANAIRIVAIASGFCTGTLDIALMAALGALGGYLWFKISGSKLERPVVAPPV